MEGYRTFKSLTRCTRVYVIYFVKHMKVKKSGGIYYTPTYIVDYIVKHTIGELVTGKKPQEVSNLRFLDPACGSGSFLIGVYQFLLDWHLNYYLNDSKQKRKKPIYQGL